MRASSAVPRRRPRIYWVSWFHRWTGIGFCLVFALWFASGLVLAFVPFPSLSEAERASKAETIALEAVSVAPAQALREAGRGTALRLVSRAGRPAYVVTGTDGNAAPTVIDAIGGGRRPALTAAQAGGVASHFGRANVARLEGPIEYDPWIVHQKFDPWRPFFRATLDDQAGTVLYVSARTGEVVQRTRRNERAWNWVGSIPHWFYYTQLRRSFVAWDRTVWWLALGALLSASAGTVLGLYRTWQKARSARPGWSGFKAWLRWHHGLGLAGCVFLLGWILSGWLSMDHGRLFSRGVPPKGAMDAYAGAPLQDALAGRDAASLRPFAGSTELAFGVVAGQPVVVGKGTAGMRVGDGASGRLLDRLPLALIRQAARNAWGPATVRADAGPTDVLYRQADGIPADAVRLDLASPAGTRVYVDRYGGTPLLVLDESRRAYSWFYYALHTTTIPGLDRDSLVRRALQVLPLLLGLALSVSGAVIGFKRLRLAVRR